MENLRELKRRQKYS